MAPLPFGSSSADSAKILCLRDMKTEEALAIARDRSVAMVKRLEALRSVEVNDPEAGEMANSKNFLVSMNKMIDQQSNPKIYQQSTIRIKTDCYYIPHNGTSRSRVTDQSYARGRREGKPRIHNG